MGKIIKCQPGSTAIFAPVGDSLTLGAGSTNPPGGGYRSLLFAANPGCIFIGPLFLNGYHAGYDGFTIEQTQANVVPWLSANAPKYLLLEGGVPDLLGGKTPAQTITVLEAAIAAYFAAQPSIAKIILSTTTTGINDVGQSTYNNDILALSIPNVIIVNGCGTLNYPADFVDGYHPNQGGYVKIANAISPTIAGLL